MALGATQIFLIFRGWCGCKHAISLYNLHLRDAANILCIVCVCYHSIEHTKVLKYISRSLTQKTHANPNNMVGLITHPQISYTTHIEICSSNLLLSDNFFMSDSPDAIFMTVSKGSSKHPKAKEDHAKRSNESSSPSSWKSLRSGHCGEQYDWKQQIVW